MEGLGSVNGQAEILQSRRVLVTGATGIVGSWVARDLVECGATVVALIVEPDYNSELYRSGCIQNVQVMQGRVEDFHILERALVEFGAGVRRDRRPGVRPQSPHVDQVQRHRPGDDAVRRVGGTARLRLLRHAAGSLLRHHPDLSSLARGRDDHAQRNEARDTGAVGARCPGLQQLRDGPGIHDQPHSAVGRAARTALHLGPLDMREIRIELARDADPVVTYDFADLIKLQRYFDGEINADQLASTVGVDYRDPAAREADPLARLDDLDTRAEKRHVSDLLLPEPGTVARVKRDFAGAAHIAAHADWLRMGVVGAGAVLASSLLDNRADKFAKDHDLGYELLNRFVPIIEQRLNATRLQLLNCYEVSA